MSRKKRTTRRQAVYLADRAVRDIAEIERYSNEQWGPAAAEKYLHEFDFALTGISEQPAILRADPQFHERLLLYRVRKHFLVCEAIEGAIIVLTVLHTSMDIPARLLELEPTLTVETRLLSERLRAAVDHRAK